MPRVLAVTVSLDLQNDKFSSTSYYHYNKPELLLEAGDLHADVVLQLGELTGQVILLGLLLNAGGSLQVN